ncbi:MAG TPA: acyl-CoA dehydrogenase family protein [Acidimicrobiales bacterium]
MTSQEATIATDSDTDIEDVESFRQRARAWIRANLEPAPAEPPPLRGGITDEQELAAVARDRELQGMLFEAGLAGICVPREYGGQGLTPAHQRALNEELAGYEYPVRFQVPTFSPCAAVLLEFGTEEQKRRHIPAMLKGEELWIQFLSEPSGGSDVAAALTTAVRDGDEWVLDGSKIWSSGAWWSDWALCLARTNWDVPKHRGLTVFIFPVDREGVEIQRIEMLSGSTEFCQEFLTDVRVPDSDRVGDVDEGWTVGTRWMVHERMSFNSPLVTLPVGTGRARTRISLVALAEEAGRLEDPLTRDLIGEARVLDLVRERLNDRLGAGVASGRMHPQAPAIGRLFTGVASARRTTIAFEIAGGAGGTWSEDETAAEIGTDFLMRQVSCIGGGTTEIARNVISERVLGMPREPTPDRTTPFRDVPRAPGKGA